MEGVSQFPRDNQATQTQKKEKSVLLLQWCYAVTGPHYDQSLWSEYFYFSFFPHFISFQCPHTHVQLAFVQVGRATISRWFMYKHAFLLLKPTELLCTCLDEFDKNDCHLSSFFIICLQHHFAIKTRIHINCDVQNSITFFETLTQFYVIHQKF